MARRQDFSFDDGRSRHDQYEDNFGGYQDSPYGNNEDGMEVFIRGGGGGGGGGTLNPPPPPRPIPPPPDPIIPKPDPILPDPIIEELNPPKPIEEGPTIQPIVGGCMDRTALNFNPKATFDNLMKEGSHEGKPNTAPKKTFAKLFIVEDKHIDFSEFWKENKGKENHYSKKGNQKLCNIIVDAVK